MKLILIIYAIVFINRLLRCGEFAKKRASVVSLWVLYTVVLFDR